MRELYSRTPISAEQQRQLDDETALLGIKTTSTIELEIEFWDEHQGAIEWWLQVQDLMRYSYGAGVAVCEGLDVLAVQADVALAGREVQALDYQKLRLIAQTVASVFNKQRD